MLSVAVVLLGAVATTWTSHGPFGGPVRAFDASRSDPAVLYAGNVNGIFRTNDGGGTWRSVGDGLGAIYLLAVDPTNPNIVFAGGSRKVFKSSDGGSHWRALSLPKELRPSALRLDPLDPRTVYVGSTCSGYYPESYDDAPGVYKSTDGGETWKASYSGIKPNTALYACVDELALDPGTPTHLYTLTRWSTSQRWVSFDAATGWGPLADHAADARTGSASDFCADALRNQQSLCAGDQRRRLDVVGDRRQWSAAAEGIQ